MPENTTARDPLVHVLGAMSDGTDRYITDMESDGQRQLVHSDQMPADAPWEDLEALGFVKGAPVRGDDLFVTCTLPDGWSREGTGHAMWSNVLDERGVTRVNVFYKAAFYDRRASASVARPGCAASTEAIYGDGPAALPAQWDVFTEEERQDFRSGLSRYLEDAERHPSIYGDRVPKVQRLTEIAA